MSLVVGAISTALLQFQDAALKPHLFEQMTHPNRKFFLLGRFYDSNQQF